jgi:hypothetical protein
MRTTSASSRERHPDVHCERHRRSSLRLLLLNETGLPLPAALLEQVLGIDPDAQMRNCWSSLCEKVPSLCATVDAIVAISRDGTLPIRHLRELSSLRIRNNYSPRPLYFAVCTERQSPSVRYEIEQLGGYFLHLFDAATHFRAELEQIRLTLKSLTCTLPRWFIVYEGNGESLRAHVYFAHRRRMHRVSGSDRQIATLAAFIKNNGTCRSLSELQKTMEEDLLFRPAGGGFDVPSTNTLKMHLWRNFPNNLQKVFDLCHSGFSAERAIECCNPGTHNTKYRIRGEWVASRKS